MNVDLYILVHFTNRWHYHPGNNQKEKKKGENEDDNLDYFPGQTLRQTRGAESQT